MRVIIVLPARIGDYSTIIKAAKLEEYESIAICWNLCGFMICQLPLHQLSRIIPPERRDSNTIITPTIIMIPVLAILRYLNHAPPPFAESLDSCAPAPHNRRRPACAGASQPDTTLWPGGYVFYSSFLVMLLLSSPERNVRKRPALI